MTDLKASFLKRLNAATHGDISIIAHQGRRFLLSKKNRLDQKMMGGLNWERHLRERAAAEIRNGNLNLFIDVGANLGLYTIDLNHRAGPLETIAFEPQPDSYNQLCGNIFINNLSDIVRTSQVALSNRNGEALLSVDTDSNIHSALGTAGWAEKSKFDLKIPVRLVRFDDHYPIENRRVFLKMDVEGHEMEALDGMRKFLSGNKASLQIESGSSRNELGAFLAGLGYRAEGASGYDRFFSNL